MKSSLIHLYRVIKEGYKYVKKIRRDKDLLNWYYEDREKLKQFHNKHIGEDCFIIGNGPSLNKMDLSTLNEYHTFGLNKIFLLFEKTKLNLSYHAAVNPLVIEQMKSEIEKNVFNCPTFLSYKASKSILNKSHVFKLLTNNIWSFYGDITQPIEEGYTVTFIAMQIAFYMGFKNVFLIGVDHNFKQVGKANEEQQLANDDDNHFHPDYFKGQKWHLADIEGNEASYSLAKHAYHQDGREIYDATLNGKLQIFSKITFEEALSKAKRRK